MVAASAAAPISTAGHTRRACFICGARESTFTTPALIIGHRRDPIHPFSDADLLAGELRNSRLVQASTILELRLKPERLTNEIADFLDECWAPRTAEGRAAS